jgi:tetratricopeptide (TPR) repeat protein
VSPPAPDAHLRVLHAFFGVSPQEMGFPARPEAASAQASPRIRRHNVNVVERREFLASGTVAGAAALGLMPGEPSASPLVVGAPVGAAHVRELRNALANLYALDDAYGGADVRPLGVRLLRRIRRVINTGTYPDTIGRQLQLAAEQTAEHCGWLCFDAGRQDDARRYWGEALTAATILHDEPLEISALASMSLQALYENRPRDAYDLARAAQERTAAGSPPPVLSLLAAREARALARMHDHQGARRALARSMRLFEDPNKGRPVPEWASFHGPAELSHTQGLLYAESGHHKAAIPYIQAGFDQENSAYGRNRALSQIALADAMIRSGEIEHGCAEAISAAQNLDEISSGRARRQVKTIKHLIASVDTADAQRTVDYLNQIT